MNMSENPFANMDGMALGDLSSLAHEWMETNGGAGQSQEEIQEARIFQGGVEAADWAEPKPERQKEKVLARIVRLANEELQQQQQQTATQPALNQPSQAISPDVSNAATQADLLRAEQLSLQHNSQLAFYAQAKAQQIDNLQASLQSAIHSQATKLAAIEQKQPPWPAGRQARTTWQNQIAQAKARLAQLERRSERMGEIAHDAGIYADSMLDELAARKLRFHHPELARQWDAIQQQQRKAALKTLQSAQSNELDLGRTRSLSFSPDS
jgi:hypothetical protein